MKVNEVVYYCLDAIKAFSDDSYVNEDHVLFLIGKYRSALLQQYFKDNRPITESNYQTIDLTLNESEQVFCTKCPKLRSTKRVPTILSIAKPTVLLFNGLDSEIIETVQFPRLKNTGYNKWKKNFIYASIGPEGYLYLSATNPQSKYLQQVKFRAVFEDFIEAMMLDEESGDIMEKDFPLEFSMIPNLITGVVKEILGVAWRPADTKNDAADDLHDIATFVRQNMKKRYNNIVEGEEE